MNRGNFGAQMVMLRTELLRLDATAAMDVAKAHRQGMLDAAALVEERAAINPVNVEGLGERIRRQADIIFDGAVNS